MRDTTDDPISCKNVIQTGRDILVDASATNNFEFFAFLNGIQLKKTGGLLKSISCVLTVRPFETCNI